LDWLAEHRVKPAFIEKGNPQQNSYVERFNGTMHHEPLNGEESNSVLEVRVVITGWMEEYNQRRPHRALGMLSPSQFAERLKVGRRLRETPLIAVGPVKSGRGGPRIANHQRRAGSSTLKAN